MERQTSLIPEIVAQSHNIYFEPGFHGGYTEAESAFSRGNLDAHAWNTETVQRIISYAYDAPALLLTLDSLEPVPPNQKPLNTPRQEASTVWIDLPARPNKLNHTGKVYVVKGDSYQLQIPEAVLPNAKDLSGFSQQMSTIVQKEAYNDISAEANAILEETAGIASLGLLLWGASKFIRPSIPMQTISRRKFLERAIIATTATTVIGSLARLTTSNIAAEASNEPTEEFLQTVGNIVRPRLVRSTFIDGRTALVLAKAEDAQAISADLLQATNVILMGNRHMEMAPTYLQDREERNTAIVAYAKDLLDTAKQVYISYFHISPKSIPLQVTQFLLNYVSQEDIVEVTDPGGLSFQPNVTQSIDKQVTLYKSFHSPQVEEAIKPLRLGI